MLNTRKLVSPWVFILAAAGLFGQSPYSSSGYGGPSVLSRGGNRAGYRGSAPINFRWFAGVGGSYETGLLAGTVENGRLVGTDLYGGLAEWGAYGAKEWKRSVLGLDYRGDYRKYNRGTFYDGSDHALSLGYVFEPNRRLNIGFFQTAGTSSRAFGGYTSPAFFSPDLIGVPEAELFDNRIYYLQSSATLHYQTSARTIFGLAGDGFMVRRKGAGLADLNGYRASGRVERATSRRTVVGAIYDYIHFDYPGAFGASDIHGLALQIRRQFTRTILLTLNGGVYRLETLGTRRVSLPPEIQAILGRQDAIEAVYRVNYWPQIQATIEHRRLNHGANLSYTRGVSPGNGVYLTSGQESLHAGYSYTGVKKWAFGLNAGTSRFNSLYQTVGRFESYTGGGGASYFIGRDLVLNFQADARKFSAGEVQGRSGFAFRMSLNYSPGELPLSLW